VREVTITAGVTGPDGDRSLPLRYQIARASPSTARGDELSWVASQELRPSWLLVDQDLRDSASSDALIAGVLLGAAAGFVAPLLEKIVSRRRRW